VTTAVKRYDYSTVAANTHTVTGYLFPLLKDGL
jgi:hypothetical protein